MEAILRRQATPVEVVDFSWARRLTVDAFYTSKIGIADLGYLGNKGMAKFEVPAEAIRYALTRSGLG